MSEPTTYPLVWPAHKARTNWRDRKGGRFRLDGRDINRAEAVKRVHREIEMLGGRYPIVSSDAPIRKDGLPYSGRSETPDDPGVCVYFQMNGKPYAMACDTYGDLAQNIAAVAAHIDATRAITRHGVATAAESLQAFSALPPPAASTMPVARPWNVILDLPADLGSLMSPDVAKAAIEQSWRMLAKVKHPDAGGSPAAMAEINRAKDEAMQAIGAR